MSAGSARLSCRGLAIGAPDAKAKVADLSVTGDASKGSLSGSVTLSPIVTVDLE